ncbi:MAG TPA: phosphate ABC transporter substrate-binding protein PstS [Streptosporangiaceae bacterium]|nr:phosphate ABC transporter substrate-binding protein PstS [Streptosporangiaceae bacterium]
MQPRGRKQVAAGIGGIAALAVAVSLSACSSPSSPSGGNSPTAAPLTGTLNGSGSTFQTTFQQAAISQFKQIQPGMTVNYGGGGSGKGRSDLASGVVNYAGSDSPIPTTEASNFAGKTILYFPVVIGPITMSYNLPNVSNLKLDPTVIANIFQGTITTWNNPAITALNPGVSLPSTPITTVVRADSSGTTANFSLFLQTAEPSVWKLGSSSTISWPHSARAAQGNSGIAQVIKSTQGAIGYVDYADAKASGLTFASVKNSSGNFIAPSPASASASAAGVTVNPDLTFHAVWGSGAQAYPITYQSWILVNAKQPNANDAKMLQAYIGYLLGDGQKLLNQLGYATLPASIDQMAKAQLSKITG